MPKNSSTKEVKKVTVGIVLGWFFGIIFLMMAIRNMFNGVGYISSAIFIILAALVVLPPMNNYIKKKYNWALSGGVKVIVVFILFMLFFSSLKYAPIANEITKPATDNLKDSLGIDNTPPEQQEIQPPKRTKSATLTIDRVTETAANLDKIRVTITNAGDVSFTPKFDVKVTNENGKVKCEGSPWFGIGSLGPGEKKTDEIQILDCTFNEDGDYKVNVELLDEDFNKLASASKVLTVAYWDQFNIG